MRLCLVRHGESEANKEGRLQGQLDFPLSEQGQEQAKMLGKWMAQEKIDHLYSSDLSRAMDTAKEVAVLQRLPIQQRKDLREMHLGRFQGLTRTEIKDRYPRYATIDWITSGLEDVEQASELQKRGLAVIEDLLSKHAGERVVAVTHGGLINCTLMALLDIPWHKRRVFAVGNTSITTLDFRPPRQFTILGVNERPHLQSLQLENKHRKGAV